MSEELQAAMQLHASPLPPVRQQSPEPPQHGQGEGPEAIRPPSGGRSRLVPVPGGGVPGGGTQLPTGDQPGDPWATLVVVLADGLMGERPPPRAASSQPCIPAGRERLPPPVAAGIASAVELSGAVARSLVVCGGGGGASAGRAQGLSSGGHRAAAPAACLCGAVCGPRRGGTTQPRAAHRSAHATAEAAAARPVLPQKPRPAKALSNLAWQV
mmetsp:Transcript_4473/g.14518  ORF Transcript_4473/g.14518 Transcript_4473/m.14518 type:complete len:213 (+) Transcript_4473:123-761(+)